ncbi:MAG: phosphate acyltransferase PlsX [Candidatus Marinimicrobia bacterium]|nr:phosphate acyltransferase PlsX [Candidatus Neomarinimicrobiota bacterium]MBT6862483.1 phosphate acyltransferase PlsX [Candidatus Neomarinimicrobiota bacterium]
MGGDQGLEPNVKGAIIAANSNPVRILLVGDQIELKKALEKKSYPNGSLEIIHAPEFIGMDESPRESLEKKPGASILVAAQLVHEGKADALVSAGSTGAVVLAAAKFLTRIQGIRRTAIATVYPTLNEFKNDDHLALMLDVGASVKCEAEELVQFAIMGAAYVENVRGVENPSVALLNIGEEATKGGEKMKTTYQLLKNTSHLNFSGNVEGKDILRGIVDVVVTEGFVGNIVIKTLEGAAKSLGQLTKMAWRAKIGWKLGLFFLRKGLTLLKEITDYAEYGGAPLLGFEKMVILAHGRSNGKAISNAIKVASKCVRDDVCGKIEKRIQNFESQPLLEYQRLGKEF